MGKKKAFRSEERLLSLLLAVFGYVWRSGALASKHPRRLRSQWFPFVPVLVKILMVGFSVLWMYQSDPSVWRWTNHSNTASPWSSAQPMMVFALTMGQIGLQILLTAYFRGNEFDAALTRIRAVHATKSPLRFPKAMGATVMMWTTLSILYALCSATLGVSTPVNSASNLALGALVRFGGFFFHFYLISGLLLGGFVFILLCQIQTWDAELLIEQVSETVLPIPQLQKQHSDLRKQLQTFGGQWQSFFLLFTLVATIDLLNSFIVITKILQDPSEALYISAGVICVLYSSGPIAMYITSVAQLLATSAITTACDGIRDTTADLLIRERCPREVARDATLYIERTSSSGFSCFGFRVDSRVIGISATLVVSAIPVIISVMLSN